MYAKCTKIFDRQTELSNCNFIKTVLMLLVVFGHCVAFWRGDWFNAIVPVAEAPILGIMADFFSGFHVHTFTLVSGFIFYHIKVEKGGYTDFGKFAVNKAKRLLVPYVFIGAIWVVPISSYLLGFDAADVIYKYVLGTGPAQLWFLLMLFDVFLIFWPFSGFFEKHDFAGFAIVLGFYAVGLMGNFLNIPNLFGIWNACKHIVLFWLGFKLSQNGMVSNGIKKIPWYVLTVLFVVLFVAMQYTEVCTVTVVMLLSKGIELAVHVAGALATFVILQRIGVRVKWQNLKWFAFLSERSMLCYMLHQQAIYFSLLWFNGLLNPYLHVFVNFAVAMFFSLAVSALLLKYRPLRILAGEK